MRRNRQNNGQEVCEEVVTASCEMWTHYGDIDDVRRTPRHATTAHRPNKLEEELTTISSTKWSLPSLSELSGGGRHKAANASACQDKTVCLFVFGVGFFNQKKKKTVMKRHSIQTSAILFPYHFELIL